MEENETAGDPQQVLQGICGAHGVGRESAGVFYHPSRHGVRAVWALLRGKWLRTQTGRVAFQKQTGMSIVLRFVSPFQVKLRVVGKVAAHRAAVQKVWDAG